MRLVISGEIYEWLVQKRDSLKLELVVQSKLYRLTSGEKNKIKGQIDLINELFDEIEEIERQEDEFEGQVNYIRNI